VDFLIEIKERNNQFNQYQGFISKVNVDRFMGKVFRIRARIKVEGEKRKRRFSQIMIRGVDAEWRKEIDDYSNEQKDKLLIGGSKRLSEAMHSEEIIQAVVPQVIKNVVPFMKVYNQRKYIDREALSAHFRISTRMAGRVSMRVKHLRPDLFNPQPILDESLEAIHTPERVESVQNT
jgi:hypothetical protein